MAESKHEDGIFERHKKERKELQAKIQNLKHGVTKGDKKKKKEISSQIAMLEEELSAKHDRELEGMSFSTLRLQENGEENSEENSEDFRLHIIVNESGVPDMQHILPEASYACQRISKAQKRRNKIALKAKKREEIILQEEFNNLSGARYIESEKLNKILSSRGLSIYEVPSDGDCLYKAVEHQLSVLSLQNTSVTELRRKTSDYMRKHPEDFIPFLINPESGDVMSNEKYEAYCSEISCKPIWGGQIEIQALSHVCSTPVEVIQADGPSIITGEHYSTAKLILSYHRHMYGLGEHYNSVVRKDNSED